MKETTASDFCDFCKKCGKYLCICEPTHTEYEKKYKDFKELCEKIKELRELAKKNMKDISSASNALYREHWWGVYVETKPIANWISEHEKNPTKV